MPGPLKNARHERFAQELAKGSSQDKAYELAGFTSRGAGARANASRLLTDDNISARVLELKARAAEKTVVTIENLTERLLKIAQKGEDAKDAPLLSVARASLMDAAKLNGLIIDRSRIGFDLSGLSDEDIDALDRILGKTAPNA
jgi:phage terminase small subunit